MVERATSGPRRNNAPDAREKFFGNEKRLFRRIVFGSTVESLHFIGSTYRSAVSIGMGALTLRLRKLDNLQPVYFGSIISSTSNHDRSFQPETLHPLRRLQRFNHIASSSRPAHNRKGRPRFIFNHEYTHLIHSVRTRNQAQATSNVRRNWSRQPMRQRRP